MSQEAHVRIEPALSDKSMQGLEKHTIISVSPGLSGK